MTYILSLSLSLWPSVLLSTGSTLDGFDSRVRGGGGVRRDRGGGGWLGSSSSGRGASCVVVFGVVKVLVVLCGSTVGGYRSGLFFFGVYDVGGVDGFQLGYLVPQLGYLVTGSGGSVLLLH